MRIRILLLTGSLVVIGLLGGIPTSAQEPPLDEWEGERSIEPSSTYGSQSFFDTLGAPLAIPNEATVNNSIVITDEFPIADLNVFLDISHTWVGDLLVTLTHIETGTALAILDRPGRLTSGFGCGGDNIDATLDDEAAVSVETQCLGATPTIDGTFTPNQLLSGFDGESTGGTWTLSITDSASPDTGTLNSWSMGARGTSMPVSSAPFIAIPDNNPAGVSDSIFVSTKGTASDLNLLLVMGHTWVGDVIVTLKHEETGTTVVLIDRPGYTGSGFGCSSNNINALLDDEAGIPAESQCSVASPAIGGSVTPNNPLSAFDGESVGGTWTVTASDNAGGDTGELTFWSLQFSGEGCAAGVNNGFEQGFVDSSFIPCWTTVNNGPGLWCTQTGAAPPDCGDAPVGVPVPPQGARAAMTNQFALSSMVVYRCGIPTLGGLRFSLYLNTLNAAGWTTAPNLTPAPGNQQLRADLVSRDAILDDPFTLAPQHILMNLYQTQPADPVDTVTYSAVTRDISAFIGQTVCLRFAVVAGDFYLLAGIDDVIFQAKEPKDDPDQDAVKNDVDHDDDNDGCSDAQENQSGVGSQTSGGLRNPHNFWDVYDVPTGGGMTRDRSISALDIFGVIGRFNTVGSPAIDPLSPPPLSGYHTAFDRGGIAGPSVWDLNPANGSIAAPDIFGVIAQFNHTCA